MSNFADVAELVDALDLGSSVFGVRVRVSSSAWLLFTLASSIRFSNSAIGLDEIKLRLVSNL